MGSVTKEYIKAILTAAAVSLIILQFILPTTVYGSSMAPTLSHRDYLLVSRQAYAFDRQPERGDVVVFHSHLRDSEAVEKRLIKRVVGLPGETVAVADGKVYINGEALQETYTADGVTNGEMPPTVVPEGRYFCLGDNRLNSTDSRDREVGFVREEDMIGKVVFRLYPFDKIGRVGREA